jgi:hypothetical protein
MDTFLTISLGALGAMIFLWALAFALEERERERKQERLNRFNKTDVKYTDGDNT